MEPTTIFPIFQFIDNNKRNFNDILTTEIGKWPQFPFQILGHLTKH